MPPPTCLWPLAWHLWQHISAPHPAHLTAPHRCRSVAVEAQFYLMSPLVMWAAFSPARRAPRRWGAAGRAAGTLVGVGINAAILGVDGVEGFPSYGFWPPPFSYTFVFSRSPPYVAGMLAALVVQQAQAAAQQRLPTLAPSKDGSEGGASNKAAQGRCVQGEDGSRAAVDQAAHGSSGAPGRGSRRGRCLQQTTTGTLALDLLAVTVICGLTYCGVGNNR